MIRTIQRIIRCWSVQMITNWRVRLFDIILVSLCINSHDDSYYCHIVLSTVYYLHKQTQSQEGLQI